MQKITLDDLRAFHADVLCAADSGLPVELGWEFESTLSQELRELEARVAGSEDTLGRLSAVPGVSSRYLSALMLWVGTERAPMALEPLTEPAFNGLRQRSQWRVVLLQPLVWLAIGYLALLTICLTILPGIDNLRLQMHRPAGWLFSVLLAIRTSLPIWAVVVPLGLLIVTWWSCFRRSSRTSSALREGRAEMRPGTLAMRYQWLAQVAAHASRLTKTDASAEQIQQMARDLASTSSSVVEDVDPPLLGWALSEHSQSPALGSEEQDTWLVASRVYRMLPKLVGEQLATKWWRVGFTLLGGVVTLLLALCVFLPLIDLLLFVSQPAGS